MKSDASMAAHQERRQTLVEGGLIFAGVVFGRVAFLATNILIARSFGPDGFGLYAIGWSVLTLFVLFAPLGLTQAIIRFAEARRTAGTWPTFASHVLLLGSAFSVALATLMLLSAPFLAEKVFQAPHLAAVLSVMAPAVFLRTVQLLLFSICRGANDFRTQVLGQLIEGALTFLLVAAVVAAGLGLLWATAIYPVSLAVSVVFALHRATHGSSSLEWPRRTSASGLREVLGYGVIMMLTHGATVLNMTADRLVLGVFGSPSDVGLYQAASQLSLATNLVLVSVANVFAVKAARLHVHGQMPQIAALARDVNRWTTHALVPLACLFLLIPSTILSLTFGAGFGGGGGVLAVLTAGQLAMIVAGQSSTLLITLGFECVWLIAVAAAVLANVVGALILVPEFGGIGAAASTAATAVGLAGIAFLLVRQQLGFAPVDRATAKSVLVAGPLVLIAAWLAWRSLADEPAFVVTVVLLTVAYAAYALCCLVLGLHPHDRQILGALRSPALPTRSPARTSDESDPP